MSKIRVLSDQLANQIAAGEVVERPASVAKELVENAIDAGARRLVIDVEAGGRRLLRVADDGEGMMRDDAVLAFERHATSKINSSADLDAIATLGFRGEALASIASVARVELITKTEDAAAGTRVFIEGGRMREVKDAAHPRGTTLTVRDLFFNVPARRKFLRSEATESFHLANLVTHYALAHPEIAFTLTNGGREVLRVAPAADLHERAYQIFGAEFLDNLLEVNGGHEQLARVRGYVSAPRERRTSRDGQYLFINGRYVRDRLLGRALSEGYRSILPHGVFPVALLFLEVPLADIDVNVHPAKTEVRFRRAAAVADAVREAVRNALASAGYVRGADSLEDNAARTNDAATANRFGHNDASPATSDNVRTASAWETDLRNALTTAPASFDGEGATTSTRAEFPNNLTRPPLPSPPQQNAIDFGFAPPREDMPLHDERFALAEKEGNVSDAQNSSSASEVLTQRATNALARHAASAAENSESANDPATAAEVFPNVTSSANDFAPSSLSGASAIREANHEATAPARVQSSTPQFMSAAGLVREVAIESVSHNIRPLGQLEESFIIATDDEGLILIDQHAAHERVLFDKYRALENERVAESQNLLLPETFDLTPAQAAAFETVASELELYGFGLMRLSGRTVAIKAVPADLPAGEARNMLSEILETIDAEKRGSVGVNLRERVAASLACHAAIKINTPLAPEKMRWLIDRLLLTSSPTTCPHGRPAALRLTTRDIQKGVHRI
jgi:DNA mismatch repair protein MutL